MESLNNSRGRRPQEAQSRATFDFRSGSSGCPMAGQGLASQGYPTAPARSRATRGSLSPGHRAPPWGWDGPRPGLDVSLWVEVRIRPHDVSDTAPRRWGRPMGKGRWPAGSGPTVPHGSVAVVTCAGPGPKWLMRAGAGAGAAFPWLCLAVRPMSAARVRCSGPQQGSCSA